MDMDARFRCEINAELSGDQLPFENDLGSHISLIVEHEPGPFEFTICQWTKDTCADSPKVRFSVPFENAVALAEMILAVDRSWAKAVRANKDN